MTDPQYDSKVVADPQAGGPETAPKAKVPGWVWAVIGVMGTLIVVGAVLIVFMLPGWLAQRPGTTANVAGSTVATPPPTTGGGTSGSSSTKSSGGGTSGSSSTKSSGGGSSGSSSTKSSGGGSSSTGSGSTADLTGLVAVPNLGAQVAGWQKAYPADANPYFYGTDQQSTQPFSLPAGKMRIEFAITSGAAQTVDVAIMDTTGSQPGQYWTVPGTATTQPHYFAKTTTDAGQWYVQVIPHTGTINWQLKVSRWGLP